MRCRFALQAAALLGGTALAAVAAPLPAFQTPNAKVGPYQVAIDRITANRTNQLQFRTGDQPRRMEPGLHSTRLIQLQIGLFSEDPSAEAGLTTFQVKGITVELRGRSVDLVHYGGVLENPNDKALVRAYVYIPNFPLGPREIRYLEGEVVSYDHSAPLQLALPLAGARLPLVVTQDGVKATLRELTMDGSNAQIDLLLEGAPGSVLVNTVNDGTYGVSLLGAENRVASPNGGTMLQPHPNQAEYRLSFGSLRGAPDRLSVKLVQRAGARHVYPFRLEHLPLPDVASPEPPRPAPG